MGPGNAAKVSPACYALGSRSLEMRFGLPLILMLAACGSEPKLETVPWKPVDIRLEAAADHPWWSFPVRATWTHETSGEVLEIDGVWDGGRTWLIRFAPPGPGSWRYRTQSEDSGLDGRSGSVEARPPTQQELDGNPNLRGGLRASADGRYFERADGTPFLLLADTLWAGNTARAGLGERGDGPFFKYIEDRKSKGFTTVLMSVMHAVGDYPDEPAGHANEGGHVLLDRDFERLNPEYFAYSDRRWQALHDAGFAIASPFAWWGKTQNCIFDAEQSRKLAAYFAARYGAFNVIWALAGEYQYTFRDCGWTEADIDALGAAVQARNPYRRPVSIHPSGQTRWEDGHGVQSSRPFQASSWLDHHWLQTGQSVDRMYNIVGRAEENSALEPARPVFCSEAYYERSDDPDGAYHSRWQAWTALLSGCAGYGYGAQGVWQFRDPEHQEPGKLVPHTAEWREAIDFEGSRQAGLVAKALGGLPWHRFEPARESVLVDGRPAGKPTPEDLTPPTHAEIPGELHAVYLPRGNAGRRVQVAGEESFALRWVDPRTGESRDGGALEAVDGMLPLPVRPAPVEDWVAILEAR